MDELEVRRSSGTVTAGEVRLRKMVVEQLRAFQRIGAAVGGGSEAFDALGEAYAQLVSEMSQFADESSSQLENAFAFIAQTFGNEREMLVFVSGLSTRPTSMRFVSTFGSDGYARYSERLAVQERRNDLLERAKALEL